MKKVFLDANIILDFLDDHRNGHNTAKKLFEILIDRQYQFVISEDLLTTVYYVSKNKPVVLGFFNSIVEIWEIPGFGKPLVSEAVSLCLNNQELDLEDVLQSLCARDAGCDLIITNDRQFYDSGIPMSKSDQYLKNAGELENRGN